MAYRRDDDFDGDFDNDFDSDFDDDSEEDEVNLKFWKKGEDFLQNTFHFPSFRNLPHEDDTADGYWKETSDRVFNPGCAWFFMAEITNDKLSQIPFLRNRVEVRDRAGGTCQISFYPEAGYFDFKTLKTGNTILVTNGQQHDFMDGSVGLRIEQLRNVVVAPCSMSDLLHLSALYHGKKDLKCWNCDKGAAANSLAGGASQASAAELKKCAACETARYCSKNCQIKDWKEGHKKVCKSVPIFRRFASVDYTKVIWDQYAFWIQQM